MAPTPRSDSATPRSLSRAARLPVLILVVVVAAVALWLSFTVDLGGAPAASGPIVVGSRLLDRPAPAFELTDLDGRTVRLADYAGRPVLVNFWASWCIPCRAEFPLLREVLARPDAGDLAVLGIVYRDNVDAAREFMRAHDANWPGLLDPREEAARAYGVTLPPLTFYIDREGIVRAVSYGPPPRATFEEYLARIE